MSAPVGTILTGLISIGGVPVQLCGDPCLDNGTCGRPADHPADRYGHVCDGCVEQIGKR